MKRSIIAASLAMLAAAEAQTSAGAAEAKTPKFCEKEYDQDAKSVIFTFGNGQTLELKMEEVPSEIQTQLMLHGALQKIGDSYAGAKGNFSEGVANAQSVIDALKAGQWKTARGEGEGRPRLGELAEAIARIKGVEVAVAMAAVEKATDDQRKAWRSNAKVKAVIAQIRSEKAAAELQSAGEQSLEINLG